MIFILGSLTMGGIETFILRMAKERYRQGKKTRILLLSQQSKSDKKLVDEAKKYSDIFFADDYLLYKCLNFIPFHFLLLTPLNYRSLANIFSDIEHVHVSSSISGLFYLRIASKLLLKKALTIGVYHSKEFIWTKPGRHLPYYENINRRLFAEVMANGGVSFFNEKLPSFYKNYGYACSKAHVFPLGVIDTQVSHHQRSHSHEEAKLKLVSIGRLVSFKTYNLWMIDIVSKLRDNGVRVEYDIYGDGPLLSTLREKINKLHVADIVSLKGKVDYSLFSDTVAKYDIFVGSGTAIVEACACGVPSIIGIESCVESVSYGFCSEIAGFSYNEDGLYPKKDVYSMIVNYIGMEGDARLLLRKQHQRWSERFNVEQCSYNFDKMSMLASNERITAYSMVLGMNYSFSFFFFSLLQRCKGKVLSEYIYE